MTSTDPAILMLGAEWMDELPGGLNRYVAALADALIERGVAVNCVVVGPASNAPAYVTAPGDYRGSMLSRLIAMRGAARRLVTSADVIDSHFALYSALPLLTTRVRNRPLVVHFQGPWADESRVERQGAMRVGVKRRVERTVYRRAARVVTLSRAFAGIVVRDYGVDPKKVEVIPPGVDLDHFSPGDRVSAREKLGVDDDTFVVVSARRLERRMGLDTLIESWATVQREVPDSLLVLAGAGSQRAALEVQAAALPVPAGVRFAGRVHDDDLVRLYQAADCSVVPTRALEGFGLVVLESLACGTPCVSTDVGGLPEALIGLDKTLVVPAGDSAALASRLIDAANGRLPLREECRQHAEQYGWNSIATRHIDLYRAAARDRMRVVFLGHTAQLSGGELALARLLPALDVDAHVILAEDGPLVHVLERGGATVEVLPMADATRQLRRDKATTSPSAAASAATYAVRLARRLRQIKPDLVHTNSLKSALYGGLAGRLARVPVIWHVRDRIEDDYLGARSRRMVRALARVLPNAVIANSAETLATLHLPGRIPAIAVPSPIAVDVGAAPERGAGAFTVGMVGRVAPWKGQHVFLDAFAAAFPDGGERAVIIGGALFGEDDYAESLRELAENLGIVDRVEFRGHVTDVAAEYARLDIAVHASTVPEPFGQVVVEAMAAGVPVVAVDAGGPAEVVTDGVDGLLYAMGDDRALAAAMRRLRDDAELRARLVDGGRVRAAAFTPETVAAEVHAFYRRTTARGPDVSASDR